MIAALLAPLLLAGPVPKTADDHLAMSAVHLSVGDMEKAESVARAGLKRHPATHGFHLAIGRALEARREPALAFYEYQWELFRAGHERPEGKQAAEACRTLLESGRGPEADEMRLVMESVATIAADATKARVALERVIAERGDPFVLRMFLAEALATEGDRTRAAALFRELLEEDARFVPALVGLAEVVEKDGAKKASADLMAKARKIDPEHWRLRGK